jgi:hypothetical protein
MDDEIKQLREKLETLERQKAEEDARNKDPFRYLRKRIEDRTKELAKLREPASHPERNPEGIRITLRELESDKCVLEAILVLQADVKTLGDAVAKLRDELDAAPAGYIQLEEDTYSRRR